jgi:hypothetical protein
MFQYNIFHLTMSQANAAAIKRRVNAPQTQNVRPGGAPTPQFQPQQSQQPQTGLTLQQVIAVIDKRLVAVESGLREVKESPRTTQQQQQVNTTSAVDDTAFSNMVDEYNNRFEILAMEISNLKDVVLKLQSYTMEVNKTLLEERINILSDLGNSEPITVENEEVFLELSNNNEDVENLELVSESN